MKKFLIQILIVSLLTLSLFVLVISRADGYTDPYYVRFTTPQQESLILGTSKAAQGLQPKVINQILNSHIYNYSFNIGESPYGKVYLNSIQKKLDKNHKQGVFIVTVDPWSISSTVQNPDDLEEFRENGRILDNTTFVNSNPNLMYFVHNYPNQYIDVLEKSQNWFYLHEDGWLEVYTDIDSVSFKSNRERVMEKWVDDNKSKYQFSQLRFEYLLKTIQYLKNYGKVYLVRIPIDKTMMTYENKLMPDFNFKMKELAKQTEGYYDMTTLNKDFVFHDGVHLYKSSGEKVSKLIATWIKDSSFSKDGVTK